MSNIQRGLGFSVSEGQCSRIDLVQTAKYQTTSNWMFFVHTDLAQIKAQISHRFFCVKSALKSVSNLR